MPSRPTTCSQRAFTLVELIAVTVVTSILAGTAAVGISNMTQQRRTVAAQEIARDLTYVRQRATAVGVRHWVSFDAAADAYSLLEEDPATPGLANAQPIAGLAGSDAVMNNHRLPGVELVAINFDSGANIGFDWLGRPWSADAQRLNTVGTVSITGGASVTVDPVTGYVSGG